MDDHEYLAQLFETHRAHLRAVAYRMLGSVHEADDYRPGRRWSSRHSSGD